MAIDIINTGLNHKLNGMAVKFDIVGYTPAIIFPDDEDRGLAICCAEQLVLADNTGIINQNDVNGFMFKLAASTDTLSMFLERNGEQVAQLNNNTYGTYYAAGSITFYSDQILLTGYKLEWSKVLAAFGTGRYSVRVDYTTFGGSSSSYSNNFKLLQFSADNANHTIRIESHMDGYIMRERINYKGLDFIDMLRVKGWFGNPDEKIETINDIYANYGGEKRVKVQRKVNQNDIYMFETYPYPKCIADRIRYYHFLANTVFMSDYNLYNYDYELQRIRVYKDESFSFKYTGTTRAVIIRGKLIEQIQDLQKTNC